MVDTKKRERTLERSYDDTNGKLELSHSGDVIVEAVAGEVPQSDLVKMATRYLGDILSGSFSAALKAEGGTIETATAKVVAMWAAIKAGGFKFRAASGDGGLSVEEEQVIIAQSIVSEGRAKTLEEAAALVAAVYARTTVNKKGYTVRPDYNALKAVPQVKAALAIAGKAETDWDAILKAPKAV